MRTKQEIISELVVDVEHVAIGTMLFLDQDAFPEIVAITIADDGAPRLKTGGPARGLLEIHYADGVVTQVFRSAVHVTRNEPALQRKSRKETA